MSDTEVDVLLEAFDEVFERTDERARLPTLLIMLRLLGNSAGLALAIGQLDGLALPGVEDGSRFAADGVAMLVEHPRLAGELPG